MQRRNGPQFGQRLFQLFGREGFAVPSFFAGKKADAVPLIGAGDNRKRTAARGASMIERAHYRRHVVAIDDLRGPALGLEFAAVNFHIVLVHGWLALAESVDIGEHNEIVHAGMPREGRRFPDVSFGQFAVARQHVNSGGGFPDARPDREARAHGEPLPQGTGGRVHPGNARRGMALEFARKLPQRHEPGNREDALFRQRRVENRRGMALRHHKSVAADRGGIGRIHLHRIKKCRRHKLRGGKARSRVARACRGGHAQGVNAKQARLFAKLFQKRGSGCRLSCCRHKSSF